MQKGHPCYEENFLSGSSSPIAIQLQVWFLCKACPFPCKFPQGLCRTHRCQPHWQFESNLPVEGILHPKIFHRCILYLHVCCSLSVNQSIHRISRSISGKE